MKIEVVSVEDQEDGSAFVAFDMDEEAKETFIRIGIIKSLMDALEAAEKLKAEKTNEG